MTKSKETAFNALKSSIESMKSLNDRDYIGVKNPKYTRVVHWIRAKSILPNAKDEQVDAVLNAFDKSIRLGDDDKMIPMGLIYNVPYRNCKELFNLVQKVFVSHMNKFELYWRQNVSKATLRSMLDPTNESLVHLVDNTSIDNVKRDIQNLMRPIVLDDANGLAIYAYWLYIKDDKLTQASPKLVFTYKGREYELTESEMGELFLILELPAEPIEPRKLQEELSKLQDELSKLF